MYWPVTKGCWKLQKLCTQGPVLAYRKQNTDLLSVLDAGLLYLRHTLDVTLMFHLVNKNE